MRLPITETATASLPSPFVCRRVNVLALTFAAALALAGCGTDERRQAEASRYQGGSVGGEPFTCTPVRLWDGDGPIHCAEGPTIRLAGIAARELDGTCKPAHPCPSVPGDQSRDHLAGLLLGNPPINGINFDRSGPIELSGVPLTCVSAGAEGAAPSAAWCLSPFSGDLSCRMVRDGFALKWPRYWGDHRC